MLTSGFFSDSSIASNPYLSSAGIWEAALEREDGTGLRAPVGLSFISIIFLGYENASLLEIGLWVSGLGYSPGFVRRMHNANGRDWARLFCNVSLAFHCDLLIVSHSATPYTAT